jgi:hypothetical protein
VQLHPRTRPDPVCGCHFHRRPGGIANPPESRRRAVAQRGAGRSHENGSHPATLAGQRPVTDGIDAPMNQVEAPVGQSSLDPAPAQAELDQLSPRHDAVLALGKFGDLPVSPMRGTFCTHTVLIRPLGGHGSRLAASERTEMRET